MSNYLIAIPKTEKPWVGTIHDMKTKLKVKAFTVKSKFKPSKGEVSFFVTAGEKILAFETRGYNKHRQLLILQMISWYCMYIGLLEAQIHATFPL
jgi:putative NADPH-quinone reductase